MANQEIKGDIVIFKGDNGEVNVQIDAVNETIWATQKAIAQLFGVDKSGINRHIANIFKDGELSPDTTIAKIATVVNRGIRGKVKDYLDFYNLDVIIAVGYRVNSKQATQFRIWANKVLREYMIKGYALDEQRFIKGQSLTYFKELIDKIRNIRIQEKVFYQQIRDIYALSIDYDKDDQRARDFYAAIQNKLLWAVSGKTAAELIYYRSNAKLPQMGLTSTENKDKVTIADTVIGKNYLNKDEIENLKLIVDQYLSFAEAQALNHIPMRMADWEQNLNIILTMNRKDILKTKGKISMELAKKTARRRYATYKEKQQELEHLESIKELDEDLKKIKEKSN